MDTFFCLGRRGTPNTIHACESPEMLPATPPRFGPRRVTGAAAHQAAARCHPAHRLAQRWGLRRRCGAGRESTRERRPCLDLQPHPPGPGGHRPRQPGGIKHPPGHDPLERPTAWPPLGGAPRAGLAAPAALQQPLPDCTTPPTRVPGDALAGVVDRLPRHRGPPPPRAGRHPVWGLACPALHRPQRPGGPGLRLARRRRPQRPGGSSPFFPVKVSERTRRFSGVGKPSSPAMVSQVAGPDLTYDARPEFDVARIHYIAFCPSAHSRASGPQKPV